MKTRYSIEIDAPVETVFCWLTDRKRVVQWLPNLLESEVTYVTQIGVGSTFRQVYDENGRRFEFRGEIIAFEPDRRLAIRVKRNRFEVITDYRCEDLGACTRLTQLADVRFRGLMKVVGFFKGPSLKQASVKQCEKEFGKLKQLCEKDATGMPRSFCGSSDGKPSKLS